MARFGIAQTKINNTFYAGVQGYQVDRGNDVESEGSDGIINETAHFLMQRKPTADLTSFALKTMITALSGSTDLPLLALDGTNGMIMYGQRALSGAPGFNASSVHLTRTALRGLLYMSGIRWSPRQRAEMQMRAMFKSPDGTTPAVTESSVAALPTQPVPVEGWALSAINLAGGSITTINSLELSVDPKFEFEFSTGLPEATDILGAGAFGKLAIAVRADVGDLDIGAGTGATSLVFSQYAQGGGFGSATVTITLNSVFSLEEQVGGTNGSPMTKQLMVRTRYDGSNKPMTWATT